MASTFLFIGAQTCLSSLRKQLFISIVVVKLSPPPFSADNLFKESLGVNCQVR